MTASALAAITPIPIAIANQYCGRRAVASAASAALLDMADIGDLAIVAKER